MRILRAVIKPTRKLKAMFEILSSIDEKVRLTVHKCGLLFETMNPVHGVSTSMFLYRALFQIFDINAYPRWMVVIDVNEFSKLLNLVEDGEEVEILALPDDQPCEIIFTFYNMEGDFRCIDEMSFQPIESVNHSETTNLIESIRQARGVIIKMKYLQDFEKVLKRSLISRLPVAFQITSDMMMVSSGPAPPCFIYKGTDFITNDVPRDFSMVEVSLYDANYILDTARLGLISVLKVISDEASSLALPLLLEFILEPDKIFVAFTLPSNSVVRPELA